MLSLATTRLVVTGVSALGVSKVVGDIIKNNTVILTGSQKVLVGAGSLVLSSMIVEQACDHVNGVIDDVVEWRRRENLKTPAEAVTEQESGIVTP